MNKRVNIAILSAAMLSLLCLSVYAQVGVSGKSGSQRQQQAQPSTAVADNGNSFTDPRDGQIYRVVTIGTQTWMAENLNWAGDDGELGWCYGNDPANCATYGRLYDWSMVMGFESDCNTKECASLIQSPHRGICPAGWHIPTEADWVTLVYFVRLEISATQLKALTGWEPSSDTLAFGTDDYGFSALPGGYRGYDGRFLGIGKYGSWWSATEYDATLARDLCMNSGYSNAYTEWTCKASFGVSLRCVQEVRP
jgi:uncharacterized protein (TIGR02145 family)